MLHSILLLHLSFGASLTILSMILTRVMIYHFRIMDNPTHRSSHTDPVPKSGGISIVATFMIGVIVIYFVSDKAVIERWFFFSFVFSSLFTAGYCFYDDYTHRPVIYKLSAQLIVVLLVLSSGIVLDIISLPLMGNVKLGLIGYPISFIWILGLTNAFNFMDGLDGLAAGVAVIVSTFFCYITFTQGSFFVYIICYTLITGSLGFLFYNFPPARVFMGDVGSAFLGFVFAVLAITASRYDHSHTSFMVIPLLLFNFIYDTSFTFVRRLLRGENVMEAHRTHLYQIFNRLGYTHRTVSLFHYGICILQGFAAIWMVRIPSNPRTLIFIPFLVLQIIYSIIIMRSAKKKGLLITTRETVAE
ncbi:MAG: undecaprenyl/decaprenyl-phosphate alpha-N-acetylglucosaminyl 1-phosphate transferase [Desulfobacteraceae bacterium]|nr:MAG: undecaprenyl/decaprenyl-phosphate alpha-N-acetylglucosaminyl 1-phosphate transferase [Desulfobacteraceae bacterium]